MDLFTLVITVETVVLMSKNPYRGVNRWNI